MSSDTHFDPRRDRADVVARVLAAREAGATLRQAAVAAGIHVATVCRWQLRSPELAAMFRETAAKIQDREAQQRRVFPQPSRVDPLSVPCHPSCPLCGASAGLGRSSTGRLYYWRCDLWPQCSWRSWRPRYPENCPVCRGPRFWSHSRLSVHCPYCNVRHRVTETPTTTSEFATFASATDALDGWVHDLQA